MTRDEATRQLITCAEVLNETDAEEATVLLRVVERLRSNGAPIADVRTEYLIGRTDGARDRRVGRRMGEVVIAQMYGREYARGYADGYREGPQLAQVAREAGAC